MEVNLIAEALKFMVLGMGVVFLFLTIMIFVLKGQAKLVTKFFPAEEKIVGAKQWQPTASADNTAKKIAAITAAVQHHRNLKG